MAPIWHPPLELRSIKIQQNGLLKEVAALHQNWATTDRTFTRYVKHPVPDSSGQFEIGARDTWIRLINFFQHDLKWLLSLEHHQFWSNFVFSEEPREMLVSFLQDAPPFYLLDEFPRDEEMLKILKQTEHLVFLVFVRLSTVHESQEHYITKYIMGNMLYENYIFTIPIIFDICLHFGRNNNMIVSNMLSTIFEIQPQYINDLSESIPFLLNVFNVVTDKFCSKPTKLNETQEDEINDLLIYLFDSTVTIETFLYCHPRSCIEFHTEWFEIKISNFYNNVIPVLYEKIKLTNNQKLKDVLDSCRLELLHIYKLILSSLINTAIEDENNSLKQIDEYLNVLSETLSDNLFINDLCNLFPIDGDVDIIMQICPKLDKMKLDFVLNGLKCCMEIPTQQDNVALQKSLVPTQKPSVDLPALIAPIKDVFPEKSDDFLRKCLEYYHYNAEDVLAAILENNLPPSLSSDNDTTQVLEPPQPEEIPETSSSVEVKKYKNFKEFFNDKTELNSIRDMFSKFSVSDAATYDDEYDDTYEGVDVSVREAGEERRPFVVPRVLAKKVTSSESESEDEEQKVNITRRDHFVRNPEEVRAERERRRQHVTGDAGNKREQNQHGDVVGKKRGQGQEKDVLINRQRKNVHKSSGSNHHRRALAGRKRNQGMIPS